MLYSGYYILTTIYTTTYNIHLHLDFNVQNLSSYKKYKATILSNYTFKIFIIFIWEFLRVCMHNSSPITIVTTKNCTEMLFFLQTLAQS